MCRRPCRRTAGQADRERAVVVAARPGVQVVAAPGVVRLPGGDRVLDHDLARGADRPHRHRNVALSTRRGVQPQQVGTSPPVGRLHRQRRLPVAAHGPGPGGQRMGGLHVQAATALSAGTRTVSCDWQPWLKKRCQTWQAGTYLLRLDASSVLSATLPMTVRSVSTAGKIVIRTRSPPGRRQHLGRLRPVHRAGRLQRPLAHSFTCRSTARAQTHVSGLTGAHPHESWSRAGLDF